MKVLFRADASRLIGTGHVMRCLTLAMALRERRATCRFVCREHEGNLLERIRGEGFEAVALPMGTPSQEPSHADWLSPNWETDAEQTIANVCESTDWLIVDHYALDARWESALRPYCRKILVIDDLADRNHDCDLLLDQNLVADMVHRYDARVPLHCGRMLGPDYALLQPQYADLHSRTPPRMGQIRRILVFFGGADNENLTGRTIAAFLALGRVDIVLDVVVNPSSPHAAAIREQVGAHTNITLHESLPTLALLMMKADLAIGAGGATSWERCCLALPSLVVTVADNQKPIATELHRQGFIRWLGNQNTISESALGVALEEILQIAWTPDWSNRCKELVDGRGAERVAASVMLDSATELTVRHACVEDEALILRWANDPLVRQMAFNPNRIDAATHRIWFYKRLREPESCQIYIAETGEGLPVGLVRFELRGDEWEIHYSLDVAARGRKLGPKLLQVAIRAFRRSMNGALMFARVKQDNAASQRAFEDIGFQLEGREEYLVYRHLI